ncbi:MAG: hypothetical protein INH43_03970 [Acidobacteriaceae bacterium]|nr:hypothetical protein [Acidobacteriaceae bacterium]
MWSVAQGLARNDQEYKRLLANCDQTRRNDLAGRGTLSIEALGEFTQFFLKICIDQVTFMESLVQPGRLRARILLWAEEEVRVGELLPKSGRSWRQCCTAANCRAAMPRLYWEQANVRPAEPHCVWHSPLHWPPDGYQGYSPTRRIEVTAMAERIDIERALG